jgi:hypothetical protein
MDRKSAMTIIQKKCSTCQKWSDLIARAVCGQSIEALCIGPGPRSGEWTHQQDDCSAWVDGNSETRAKESAT